MMPIIQVPVNAVTANNEFGVVLNPLMIPAVLSKLGTIHADVQGKQALYPKGFTGLYSAGNYVLLVIQLPQHQILLFIHGSMTLGHIQEFMNQNGLKEMLDKPLKDDLQKALDFVTNHPGQYSLQFDYTPMP
jgi:hypothetical protein